MFCYLDFATGDRVQHASDVSAYERFCEFVRTRGSAYGLGTDAKLLDDEELQTALDMYNSEPLWNQKGPAVCREPKSLVLGRLVFEMFSDCPKTVENFRALCTGEKGVSKSGGKKPLHYRGIHMHRLVKGFVLQGGDVGRDDGSGRISIYGGSFKDEKAGLVRKFSRGYLGMANSGRDSNTSQFFVTLSEETRKLDGKHVCFGKAVEGPETSRVLEVLETMETKSPGEECPAQPVWIEGCGEISS